MLCGTVTQNVRRIDAMSAQSDYNQLIQQGEKYIQAVKDNPVLVQKLGPLFEKLEFGESKVVSDAYYKAKRYREYCMYSRTMKKKYPQRMKQVRYIRRHWVAVFKQFFHS